MSLFRNHIWLPPLLVPLLILLSMSLSFGQEEDILLDHPEAYKVKERSAVNFPHETHMEELECLDCHHRYENGENVLEEDELEEGDPEVLCGACHTTDSDVELRKAFHRQCMGCHIDLRKASQETGPELCGECHQK